jgi:hypothetical protein
MTDDKIIIHLDTGNLIFDIRFMLDLMVSSLMSLGSLTSFMSLKKQGHKHHAPTIRKYYFLFLRNNQQNEKFLEC